MDIDLDRDIEISLVPCPISLNVFASGATDNRDRVCGSRQPRSGPELQGIFSHEIGHVYQHEFEMRNFSLPGFGEGTLQAVGAGDMEITCQDREKYSRIGISRSHILWNALICSKWPMRFKEIEVSMSQYPKEYIPDEYYWESIYPNGDEKGTKYLRQSANMINFYFSRAYGINMTETIKNAWGLELDDWEPVYENLNRVLDCLADADSGGVNVREEMQRSFYQGEFELTNGYAFDIEHRFCLNKEE